jgi:hypothetical protein
MSNKAYPFNLYERSNKCIGDSHHIEGILGEYFQLEDFGPDRHAEIEASILRDCLLVNIQANVVNCVNGSLLVVV